MPKDPEILTVPPDGRSYVEQPRWRQDFPVDRPQDEYITRRDFARFLILTSIAFTAGQFWIPARDFFRRRQRAFPVLPVVKTGEIPIGGALVFQYPEKENNARILVRLAERWFVAYDQQCTHLLCPVIPKPESGVLHCPCHQGAFDLATGRPVMGPPQRPLPRVALEIRDDTVFATAVLKQEDRRL